MNDLKNLKKIIPIGAGAFALILILAIYLVTMQKTVKLKYDARPPFEKVKVWMLPDSSLVFKTEMETTLVMNSQTELKKLRSRIDTLPIKNIDNVIIYSFPTEEESLFTGFLQSYTIRNLYLPKKSPRNWTASVARLKNVENTYCLKKGSVFLASNIVFTVENSSKNMSLYAVHYSNQEGMEERMVFSDSKVTIPEGNPVIFTLMNADAFCKSGFTSCNTYYYGDPFDGAVMKQNGGRNKKIAEIGEIQYAEFSDIPADFAFTSFAN